MPLHKGICIPPMCVTLGWDKTAMVLTYFDTKKGIAVAQPKLWTAKDEKDALDGLMPTTVVECDGCKCWQPFPPTPWAAVPPLSANHPVILNYKVVLQVTGVQVRTKFGLCVPPGTKVQGADETVEAGREEEAEEEALTPAARVTSRWTRRSSARRRRRRDPVRRTRRACRDG
jgi:hypothetical protein